MICAAAVRHEGCAFGRWVMGVIGCTCIGFGTRGFFLGWGLQRVSRMDLELYCAQKLECVLDSFFLRLAIIFS